MIEAIKMAQADRNNADAHLCLVTQLATITRTRLREQALESQLRDQLTDDRESKDMKQYDRDGGYS